MNKRYAKRNRNDEYKLWKRFDGFKRRNDVCYQQ